MKFLRLSILLCFCSSAQAMPWFMHCYDYGCKTTQEIHFSDAQWNEIRAIFATEMDSSAEKQAIRRAVATMEKFSGEIAGTHRDVGGNITDEYIGQHDCIDESTNTFQYLAALEELDLLRQHRVALKQRRIVWFATHWTAAIAEIETGEEFAVDSWYLDNGEMPYIQPIADWRRKRDFPVAYNPELSEPHSPW